MAKLFVEIKDMDIFKNLIKHTKEFLTDERISKEIRQEYFDKMSKFIPIEGEVQ